MLEHTVRRHDLFPAYKAHRPPCPPEIKDAVPDVIEILGAMAVPTLSCAGVEADDIIGTLVSLAYTLTRSLRQLTHR